MRRLLSLAALMAAAVSCIYPFDAELPSEVVERLVVDGDILVGEISRIKVSYLQPIGTVPVETGEALATVWAEGNESGIIRGTYVGGGTYTLDTRDAGKSDKFRLSLKVHSTGKEYSTDWLPVHSAPTNLSLDYSIDDDYLHLLLSLDGNGDGYYRFDFDETWEFHADFIPTHQYDFSPEAKKYPIMTIPEGVDAMANYYCWSSDSSKEPGLATSSGLKEDRLSGLDVTDIRRIDRKLSEIYYADVAVRALSREGYDYLYNLDVNSNNTGSLFSPVPSDVRGNIRCLADSTEVIIGHVEATRPAHCEIYIDNLKSRAFKGEYGNRLLLSKPEPDEDGVIDFYQYYLMGYRPVGIFTVNEVTDVFWAPLRCVDCTAAGGVKTKPAGWPDNHI